MNMGNNNSENMSEVDQLINRVQEEVQLESNEEDTNKYIKDDWESRLNKLKEFRPYVPPSQLSSNNSTTTTKKQNNNSTSTNKNNSDLPPPPKPIDRKFFFGQEKKKEEKDDKDDMANWCCICNDDGVLRCVDCDGDAFCKRCFKETHPKDDYELRNHRTKKIR